jgi:quinoprotein glucose dehydrogenase
MSADGYHARMGAPQYGAPAGPEGLQLFKPPYGRVTAIDLNTGEHLWMQASGEGPRDHPALQGLDLPPLGWPRRTYVLLTESVLFTAQEGIARYKGTSPRQNADEITTQSHDATLRVLNPADGQLLAEVALPENATGTPITYMTDDKQYIVVPIGGASQPAGLVALRLP